MVQSAHSPAAAAACQVYSSRFEIHAERCPQLLAKIIGLFAARALMPRSLHARQSCAGQWIEIEIDVAPGQADPLAEKLRTMVGIAAVLLIVRPRAEHDAQRGLSAHRVAVSRIEAERPDDLYPLGEGRPLDAAQRLA